MYSSLRVARRAMSGGNRFDRPMGPVDEEQRLVEKLLLGRSPSVRRPKVYGFDTGMVALVRGWTSLREDDRRPLWEHLVLDVLRTTVAGGGVGYWRDKSDREIDFVIRDGAEVHAVECKVRPNRFDGRSLAVFRAAYPRGRNIVVSPGVAEPYDTRAGSLVVRVMDCRHLAEGLSALR